jgi:hypothetical protein
MRLMHVILPTVFAYSNFFDIASLNLCLLDPVKLISVLLFLALVLSHMRIPPTHSIITMRCHDNTRKGDPEQKGWPDYHTLRESAAVKRARNNQI